MKLLERKALKILNRMLTEADSEVMEVDYSKTYRIGRCNLPVSDAKILREYIESRKEGEN